MYNAASILSILLTTIALATCGKYANVEHVHVKVHIMSKYSRCQRVRITGGRRSTTPCHMPQKQLSFQMCLGSADPSGTLRNWRLRLPDIWYRDVECQDEWQIPYFRDVFNPRLKCTGMLVVLLHCFCSNDWAINSHIRLQTPQPLQ